MLAYGRCFQITNYQLQITHPANGLSGAPVSRNGATTAESCAFAPVTPSLSNIKLQLPRRQTFGAKNDIPNGLGLKMT